MKTALNVPLMKVNYKQKDKLASMMRGGVCPGYWFGVWVSTGLRWVGWNFDYSISWAYPTLQICHLSLLSVLFALPLTSHRYPYL